MGFLARWLAVAALATGCLGTSPEQQAREDLGEARDGDEEHRPGQPCLTCHGADYHPGNDVFAIAGTVYLYASDAEGIEGAEVVIVDALERAMVARTNRVGDFMIEVDSGVDQPTQLARGRLRVPWQPQFPLDIEVRYADIVQEMETPAQRDGSCAGCHTEPAGAASVGRVFVLEEGM